MPPLRCMWRRSHLDCRLSQEECTFEDRSNVVNIVLWMSDFVCPRAKLIVRRSGDLYYVDDKDGDVKDQVKVKKVNLILTFLGK